MNKINLEEVDKKWQTFWSKKKYQFKNTDKKKNFIVLKCFLTHLERFIWGTLGIMRSVMSLQGIK